MLFTDLNAEHGKPPEVQVDRPMPNLTAAGERADRMPEAGKQRPQHENGRTQFLRKPLRHHISVCGGGIKQEGLSLPGTANAERPEDRKHVLHIPKAGAVIQRDSPIREQACRKDRQRGILCAAHTNRSRQRPSARYNQGCHAFSSPPQDGTFHTYAEERRNVPILCCGRC